MIGEGRKTWMHTFNIVGSWLLAQTVPSFDKWGWELENSGNLLDNPCRYQLYMRHPSSLWLYKACHGNCNMHDQVCVAEVCVLVK